MPARKPLSLHDSAATKAARQARKSAEESVRPERRLPIAAPARLDGHELASATWRRLMRMFDEIDGEIVTRLDMDHLVDYCMLVEQVTELDKMRTAAYSAWLEIAEGHNKAKQDRADDDELVLLLAVKVVDAFEAVIKLDGRVDRKRALLLQMRQAMYLTPRARAGVAPKGKEEPAPPDDMEELLGDVSMFLNGDGKG